MPERRGEKLKWLTFFRLIFSVLLLGSSAYIQYRQKLQTIQPAAFLLYGLIFSIFLISFLYSILLPKIRHYEKFALVQIVVDTLIVSTIIYVTGNFSSIFSFLYLLVIIYASIFLNRKSTLVIAALCGIQFGVLIDLEYFGLLMPIGVQGGNYAFDYPWLVVVYKILTTVAACFVVAFLSGFLSEQERKSKAELETMALHVKRVEKMAAMGEMAAGMAHEIKNPLASITGSIQLLRDELPYSPQREKLMQIVLREADRLGTLVNDFLMFARPVNGTSVPVEIEQAVKETVALFTKDSACSGRISIRTVSVPGLWTRMDPGHLRQILWNLLLNASEAVSGKGHIEIRTAAARDRRLTIEVSDTGSGMSEDLLQQIFDPFFTTKSKGTGLGLSIVHKILQSYDARLDVNSMPGKGSTFRLSLKADAS